MRFSFVFIGFVLSIVLFNNGTWAQEPSSSPPVQESKTITGYWLTQDKDGAVEIYNCGEDVCGKFHWLKDDSPQNPSLDDKNPDPDKRSRPLCGMQFMGGFEPKGQNHYTNGWIYSPHDGNTYSSSLTLINPDTLELHGYAFFSFLGKSQYWKRAKAEPACALRQ